MKPLEIILIIAGLSAAAYAIHIFTKKKPSEVKATAYRSDYAKIKRIIDEYIQLYLNDKKQYYLFNVYSVQFDLFDYNKTYDSQPIKASFESLGIKYEDYQATRNIIKKELSKLSKIPSENFNNNVNDNGLLLLLDFYDLEAQRTALDEIEDRINEKNKERYERYKSEVLKRKNDLIKSLV